MILKETKILGETAVSSYKFTKILGSIDNRSKAIDILERMCYYGRPFGWDVFLMRRPGSTAVNFTGRTKMGENGLIVAFFALAFLAFCLTAVALYALSQSKDDIADSTVDGLKNLQLGSMQKPTDQEPDADQPDDD